ncbi:MAG: MASE1 domain-containing protein [Actinopolymorphaceae bacterium]
MVLRTFGVAVAYYISALVGLVTAPLGGPVSSLWMPAGVALVCLLAFGIRTWTLSGIAVGALAATIPVLPLSAALLATVGNTLAPVCAYLLLTMIGYRWELDRVKDVLALVLVGAFGAMMISATFGAVAISALTDRAPAEFLQVWAVSWSSDALGVLVVTPFLPVARKFRLVRSAGWQRWLEMALLLLVTFAVSTVATRTFGLLFLAFPLVIWAAWRFQLSGVAPCVLIVSAVAVDAAAQGYGVFTARPLLANILILQVFNGTIVLSGLFLAVLITEWKKSRAAVEQTVTTLATAVGHMQSSMLPHQAYLSNLRDTDGRENQQGGAPDPGD